LIGTIPSLIQDTNEEVAPQKSSTNSIVKNPKAIDRILFLNDVLFDPMEVLHLIFDTNGGDYVAACGMDYINPFKYAVRFLTKVYKSD
jgi:hypothetical protein